MIGAPFYVMEHRGGHALPHGRRSSPRSARRRTRAAGAGAGRHAGRPARGGPGGRRPGRLRPPRGLPGAAAAALGQAAGRVPQPRPARHRRAARTRSPARCPPPPRPPSCTATTGWTTSWSAPTTGSRAVLDWEMSTLGDPLTDLGLLVMYSGRPRLPELPDQHAPGGAPAIPIAGRADRAVRRRVRPRRRPRIAWYTAFAYFKLAVILEGIHYRFTLGQTVGAGFDRIGDLVPVFVDARTDHPRGGLTGDGLRIRRPHRGTARAAAGLHGRARLPGRAGRARAARAAGLAVARPPAIVEDLKAEARQAGPVEPVPARLRRYGAGLTNLQYAPLAETHRPQPAAGARRAELRRAGHREHGGAGPVRRRASSGKHVAGAAAGAARSGRRSR